MAKPPRWRETLRSSRDEAAFAIKLYNDPHFHRSFEGFVVHMHVSWLYLLHAVFLKEGVDFRYRDDKHPHKLARVEGEVKLWELARCVREYWIEPNESMRRNLEFFVKLRNNIEHRQSKFQTELALCVAGRSQAMILNYEKPLTKEFGVGYSMAHDLRLPLFVGTFTEDGEKTLRDLQQLLPRDLQNFLTEFTAAIPDDTVESQEFEMRLTVIFQKANRDPLARAVQFVNYDRLTAEEKVEYEKLGQKGMTALHEKEVPVGDINQLSSTDVITRVSAAIPFTFNSHHAIQCWTKHEIRPVRADQSKTSTKSDFCIYSPRFKQYSYTEALVNRIISKCQTADGYRDFTGCEPKLKASGSVPISASESTETTTPTSEPDLSFSAS